MFHRFNLIRNIFIYSFYIITRSLYVRCFKLKKETYKQKAEKLVKQQKRRIKGLRKRGYIIQDEPTLPKTVGKKEYERLKKKLTMEKLYNSPKNFYFDKEKQQMVSAKKGRELERSKASKKGWQKRKQKDVHYANWYDLVYDGILDQIKSRGEYKWNKKNSTILLDLLEEAIKEEGHKQTLKRIFDAEARANFLIEEILPASPRPHMDGYSKIPQFAELIKGSKLDEWEQVQVEDYIAEHHAQYEYVYDELFDGVYDSYY